MNVDDAILILEQSHSTLADYSKEGRVNGGKLRFLNLTHDLALAEIQAHLSPVLGLKQDNSKRYYKKTRNPKIIVKRLQTELSG